MISPDNLNGTVRVNFTGNRFPELGSAVFLSQLKSDSVDVSAQSEEIIFSWISPEGIVVEKKPPKDVPEIPPEFGGAFDVSRRREL